MGAKFNQVIPVLIVEDVDAAMKFYTEKLGFKVSFTSEWEYHGVVRDGLELHIGKGKPNTVSNRGANIYFMVDDIEALHAEFVASGAITAETPITDQPYGSREVHLFDPFGYHLGFGQFTQR